MPFPVLFIPLCEYIYFHLVSFSFCPKDFLSSFLLSIHPSFHPSFLPSFLYFLAELHSLRDLSFLTRDRTWAPAVRVLSPNH